MLKFYVICKRTNETVLSFMMMNIAGDGLLAISALLTGKLVRSPVTVRITNV